MVYSKRLYIVTCAITVGPHCLSIIYTYIYIYIYKPLRILSFLRKTKEHKYGSLKKINKICYHTARLMHKKTERIQIINVRNETSDIITNHAV